MIKLALLGCGKWGKNYLNTLTSIEGCELSWVCDIELEKLGEAVLAYPQIKFTNNKEDILNDDTVQGVIIATTPESHYTLAQEFIHRGKSVLVEKPVTINQLDSIDLISLAAAQDVILMAGYTLIYHSAVKEIKKLLEESKDTSNLCYLNMSRTNLCSQAVGVDVLHDLAVHDLYLSRHLVGEDPVWVIAQGGSYPRSSHNNVIYILLGYPNGKIASIFASFIHHEKTRKITLVTPKAEVVFDDIQPPDKKIQCFINGVRNHAFNIVGNMEPLMLECIHFIDCIAAHQEPHSGRQNISFIAKLTDCILESLAKGGEKIMIH